MLGLCRNYFSRYGCPHVGIFRRDLLYVDQNTSFTFKITSEIESNGVLDDQSTISFLDHRAAFLPFWDLATFMITCLTTRKKSMDSWRW